VLADGSYLVQLNPARKSAGPPITVRVIEYTVHTTTPGQRWPRGILPQLALRRACRGSSLCVTDLLDIQAYPAPDLACAYPMRLRAEAVIGHHKTDMGAGMLAVA
jgi:hypothetical protein